MKKKNRPSIYIKQILSKDGIQESAKKKNDDIDLIILYGSILKAITGIDKATGLDELAAGDKIAHAYKDNMFSIGNYPGVIGRQTLIKYQRRRMR